MLPMQKKEGWNITAKWNFFFFFRNKRKCLAKQNRYGFLGRDKTNVLAAVLFTMVHRTWLMVLKIQ